MRTDPSVSRRLLKFGLAAVLGSGFALAGTGQAHAAAFTAGDVVVYRVGDGTTALIAAAAPVFLDEYSPTGTLVQSIPLSTTAATSGNRALTAAGNATSEGLLTRSADGASLLVPGYNAAVGTAGVATTTSTTVNRVIGVANASGTVDTTTALTDAGSGNIRGAASVDGTSFYYSTSTLGIQYAASLGATTSTSISNATANLRSVSIYPNANSTSGNQLYTSTASGTNRVAQVGSGLPTTSGQTLTNQASPTGPYAFVFLDLSTSIPGSDTLYVADNGGGAIRKYTSDGTTFNLTGSVTYASVEGLTASVNGSTVNLYAANGTTLVSLTDSSGFGGTLAGTTTTIASAPATSNTAFRGVALAPVAASSVATTGAIISEFRERGLNGTEDEYVELYNTTNATLDISGWTLTYTGGGTTQTVTIPASTTITPLGHYLIVGTGYSLANYGGTGLAAGNQTLTTGIDDGSKLTLFNAASTPAAQDTVTFSTGGLVAPTTNGQYAFVRQPNLTTSLPVTTANAFNFVSPSAGTFGTAASALGAPGPENLTSPKALLPLRVTLLDPGVVQSASPNRFRDTTATSNSLATTNGTIAIRRLVTNNTGAPITRLRFRIVNLTTLNSAGYSSSAQADLRAIASPFTTQGISTSGGMVTVYGTTPDTTIQQTGGGGINSSTLESTSGTVILSTPLTATGAGSTRAYDFTFAVARPGNFSILLLFESASTTAGVTTTTPTGPTLVRPTVVPAVTPAVTPTVGSDVRPSTLPTAPTLLKR